MHTSIYVGLFLVICSSDGYVTIARFSEDAFGEKLAEVETPPQVKKTFPLVYNYDTDIPSVTSPGSLFVPVQLYVCDDHYTALVPASTHAPPVAASSEVRVASQEAPMEVCKQAEKTVLEGKRKRRITPVPVQL